MIFKPDNQKKKLLVIAGMVLTTLLAYKLSFSQAIDAFLLNRELGKRLDTGQTWSDGLTNQTGQKKLFYQKVLKSYRIRKEDPGDQVWQQLSGIAIAKGIKIGFTTAKLESTTDTLSNTDVFKKTYMAKGNYFNLVSFSDSLNRTTGIGRIAELKVSLPKENKGQEYQGNLVMDFTLTGKLN